MLIHPASEAMEQENTLQIDCPLMQDKKEADLENARPKSDSVSIQPDVSNKDERPKKLDSIQLKWLLASCNCEYATLSKLLQQHTELVNCKSFIDGNTALHYAAKFGDVSCLKLLAGTYKANVNVVNDAGETALHVAYYHSQLEVCRELESKYGANKDVFDYAGYLPRDHEKKRMEDEAKYNLPNSTHKSSLMAPIIINLPRRSSNVGHHSQGHLPTSPNFRSNSRSTVAVSGEPSHITAGHYGSISSGLTFFSMRRSTEPANNKVTVNRTGKGSSLSISSGLRKAKTYLRGTFDSLSPQHASSHIAKDISSPLEISSPLMSLPIEMSSTDQDGGISNEMTCPTDVSENFTFEESDICSLPVLDRTDDTNAIVHES